MMPKIFPITSAFDPQRRHGHRITSRHFSIQVCPEAEEHGAVSSGRSQPCARQRVQSAGSRANKIAHLRRAVENGTYCVSAEQIAEKIVQEMVAEIFA
jgi:anti-sigma28 factor (negative regulator of flagellin synthesis)